MKFKSTKRFGPITTGHRQWRDKGHCSYVHGYGRYVRLTFEATELDERGWVMDFGDLAANDPVIPELKILEEVGGINLNILPEGYLPGIEESCRYLYDKLNPVIQRKTNNRVEITRVEIWETEKNQAEYVR